MSHGPLTEPEGNPSVYSLSYREDKHGDDKRTWKKKDTIPGFPQPCLQKTKESKDRIARQGWPDRHLGSRSPENGKGYLPRCSSLAEKLVAPGWARARRACT